MKKNKELIIVFILIILALIFLLFKAPLKKEYSDSPEGWSSGGDGQGLAFLVGNFNLLSTQLHLKSNDYLRLLHYAGKGYIEGEYFDKLDGENNFYQILKELIGEPDFYTQLPDSKANDTTNNIVDLAYNDGYKDIDRVFINNLSPIELDVEKSFYSWRPDGALGNEYDPYWGSLRKSQSYSCKIDNFPFLNYQDLVNEANITAKATINMYNSKYNSEIRNLVTNFTNPQNGQPGRVVVNIFLNYLNDNNFDLKKRDEILANFLTSLFDLSIITYKEKYYYLIGHLGQLSNIEMRQSWLQTRPPYPSEFGAFGELFNLYVKKFGNGKNIRFEIPGSQVSSQSTRVYRDGDAFFTEFTTASILFGFDYPFSILAGKDIGRCLFNEFNYKKI